MLTAFLDRARREPRRTVVTLVERGRDMAFGHAEVRAGAARFANLYRAHGAAPGDVVLISLEPGIDLYHAFLGALWAGCVPAMMPFPSPKQDAALFWSSHRALFGHLGGGLFVTFPANVAAVSAEMPEGLLRVVTPEAAVDGREPPPHAWGSEAVCCLQHSSGTTALKKGVPLTVASIARQVESYAAALGLGSGDTIVSWLPLYHDMGFVAAFLMPLLRGNPVVMMSPFAWLADPLALLDAMVRHDGRFTWLPNFAFHHLAVAAEGAPVRDLSRVTAFIDCSEPCKAETFDLFLDRFAPWGVRADQLQTCYAMAETVFAVTQTRVGETVPRLLVSGTALRQQGALRTPVHDEGALRTLGDDEGTPRDDTVTLLSVGRPIAGIELRVARTASGAAVGEIEVRGPFVFGGYFRRDSADVFRDGWYRTGDIGAVEGGELYVLGRAKDLIIVLGKNFLAHELEALVGRVAGVKPGRAVALGVFNPDLGSEDAVIVAELDGTVPAAAVRTSIRAVLSGTVGLVPKSILAVPQGWLIKSTSGKISRSANLAKFMESRR